MTKISSAPAYPNKPSPVLTDKVIGTDSQTNNQNTVNFLLSDIQSLIVAGLSAETGGTLKVTEIVYSGALTTPEAVANQLDPAQIIQRYEVVILNINGNKYQLKLQNVVIGILQDAVTNDDFIPISLVATNLSEDISFYKGFNLSTEREEFYSIGSVGFSITKEIVSGNETGKILLEQTEQTNLGTGVSVYKGFNATTKKQEYRRIASDTQIIELAGDTIKINTPSTASIPALYVNNLYIPTYNDWLIENQFQNSGTAINGFIFRGKGTLAQPFTDSIVYPLAGGSVTITPNTAIQNALDGDSAYALPYSYVGSTALSYSRLNPQRIGQQIIVQDNNSNYIHSGDYNYNNVSILFNANVLNTTSNYAIDMDDNTYFDAVSSTFTINVSEGKTLQFTNSLGFRNSGNNSSAPPAFDTGRIGIFLGEGTVYFTYNGADILTRYIFNGEGNNNDNNLHFVVKCRVRADQQGIYLTKNKMGVDFYNQLQSGNLGGSGDIALKAFHMTGGLIRFYEKGAIYLANENTGRTYGFTFEPTGLGIGNCNFQLNSARVSGHSEKCFAKLNDENVSFLAFNSPSGDGFATTLVNTSIVTNGLFENLGATRWGVNFKNNVFSLTGIDQTKVDLTQGNDTSSINFVGNNVIETLVVYSSKANAKVAGLSTNAAFIKRNIINAVDLLAGVEYKVITSGSPSLGAVGSFFTATGLETGTGTASLETREILT